MSCSRVVTAVVLVSVVGALAPSGAAAAHRRSPRHHERELAALTTPHRAFARPSTHAHLVNVVRDVRPITGQRTVLPVVDATRRHGHLWLKVRLPGRPNQHTGWVTARGTVQRFTGYAIVVQVDRRRVLVSWRGHRVRTFTAIVGKPSTPTPHGRFFVEEMVRLSRSAAGAPFALATSARSNVLQRFEGGVGQIALHGTGNLSGRMGTAASHGCVRLGPAAIHWLSREMKPGVPIEIRGH